MNTTRFATIGLVLMLFVHNCAAQPDDTPQPDDGDATKHDAVSNAFVRCIAEPVALPYTLEWKEDIEDSHVSVEWTYGNETCDSVSTCFGIADDDTPLEPQLVPLQVQHGMHVRFFASNNLDVNFTIQPRWVTEEDFKACHTSVGLPIIAQPEPNEFPVNSRFLRPGDNYFIVNNWDPIYKCEYGLRLNVTVKEEKCHQPGETSICNERGHCLTSHKDDHFHCVCCPGYSGVFCGDRDACVNKPCLNEGACIDHHDHHPTGTEFSCRCAFGFYGDTCEYHVDDLCTQSPCSNQSTCEGNSTQYVCHCAAGFTGLHCEVNVNECASNPCVHGVCMDVVDGYHCFCKPGYGGRHCEQRYSECQSSPCKNGGFCSDSQGAWECHCGQGYTGKDCTMKIDLCNPSPCYNATECVDYGNTFSCTCNPGFTGSHCEIDVNECESSPCKNGGSCVDHEGYYVCRCPTATLGQHCENIVQQRIPRPEHVINYPTFDPHPHSHIHNLLIVAGTLAGALLIAMSVLAICYCRLYGRGRLCAFNQFKYKKHINKDPATDTSQTGTASTADEAPPEASSCHHSSSHHYNAAYRESESRAPLYYRTQDAHNTTHRDTSSRHGGVPYQDQGNHNASHSRNNSGKHSGNHSGNHNGAYQDGTSVKAPPVQNTLRPKRV